VPACSSSPIDLLAARIGSTSDGVTGADEPADLVAALAAVPDPRCRRGIRHRLVTVLALAVCAVLAGARSYVAIAEWAHDLPLGARVRLGLTVGRATPSESAIRRILQKVDPEALDRVVSDWLVARVARTSPPFPDPPGDPAPQHGAGSGPARIAPLPPRVPSPRVPSPRVPSPRVSSPRVIAVDGKSARGARCGADDRAVHLLAAFDTRCGIVLGQSVVDGKSNEITAFTPLLDRVDITDAIITADALHTQDEHARYLHRRCAHYVFIVKGNRPKLHQQLAGLPWADIPTVDLTQDTGHGRRESRTLKLAALHHAVTGPILFPHAQLAVQIVRRRRPTSSKRWHTETVYAVTDLSWQQTRADQLAEAIREHWHVEVRREVALV
jgi:predicted transposase YbfD/YdcC